MLIVGTVQGGLRGLFLSTACTVFKEKGGYKWKIREHFSPNGLVLPQSKSLEGSSPGIV